MCHFVVTNEEGAYGQWMSVCGNVASIMCVLWCDHWPGTRDTKVRLKTMRPGGAGGQQSFNDLTSGVARLASSQGCDELPGKESWWSLWIICTYGDQYIYWHCYIPQNVLLKCQALFIKFWQLEYSFPVMSIIALLKVCLSLSSILAR